MKVIDLLNKIAKGEEVPEKIKVNKIIFEYQGDDYLFIDEDNTNYWLFSEPYSNKFNYLESFLKTEVEIIEEDKDIEELNIPCNFKCTKNGMTNSDREQLDFNFKNIENKINELIKEVNKLKGKYE